MDRNTKEQKVDEKNVVEIEEALVVNEISMSFSRIVELIKAEFVAVYEQESDNCLLMRSVLGKQYRICIEEVKI